MKIARVGNEMRMVPAINKGQSVINSVRKLAIPNGSVYMFSVYVTITGQRNSFQEPWKV